MTNTNYTGFNSGVLQFNSTNDDGEFYLGTCVRQVSGDLPYRRTERLTRRIHEA